MPNLIEKTCPVCGVAYAIPFIMNNNRREDGGSWFCPNGHNLVFIQCKSEELQRELNETNKLLSTKNALLNRELELSKGYRNTIATYKGHLARSKNKQDEG